MYFELYYVALKMLYTLVIFEFNFLVVNVLLLFGGIYILLDLYDNIEKMIFF